ncbi:MAG: polysaccharide deacetylase family protein [Gaiellales bacterium]
MSIYARRRTAVLCVLALIAGGAYALLRGGGSSSPSATTRSTVSRKAVAGRAGGKELVALAVTPAGAKPTHVVGEGPFITVSGRSVHRVQASPGNMVALTFDDGPGPETPDVLEELQHEHAHATFFVIGDLAQKDPEMVRTLYAAGMQIGNHTWTHPQLARLTAKGQRSELEKTQNEIASIIGVRPRFYRPPYWSWNDTTAQQAGALGMVGVLFSVDTDDWQRPGADTIIRNALKAQAGDVIAFHDAGGDRSETVAAIAPIIVALRARHLEPVTLDQLYGRART